MKTTKILLSLATLSLCLAGCTGPNARLSPAIVQQGVATGVAYSVVQYPQAAPYLHAAAPVVCASAAGTNISPAAVVAAVQSTPLAEKLKTPEGVLILNSALLLYTGVWESYGTNAAANSEEIQPYLQATCDGLNQGLSFTTLSSRLKSQAHWPKVRFGR